MRKREKHKLDNSVKVGLGLSLRDSVSGILSSLKNLSLRRKVILSCLCILAIVYYFSLPKTLFKDPTSTVLLSQEEVLLGAKIADDGQWRFPAGKEVPAKFKIAIITYEDQHFYKHPGFNPAAIVSALRTNIKAGEVKRGGSTLTQQVIRMSRRGKSRTYWEKGIELILATRLEIRFSKKKILQLYSNNAPFGGNVVGLDAAAWRYFGRESENLSWAEAATLAVLPNAPGLIHPGKNRDALREKRDQLLEKLYEKGKIDEETYKTALLEKLPEEPLPLPRTAAHLLERVNISKHGKLVTSSIDSDLQEEVNRRVAAHYNQLKQNEVRNAAVLVVDVRTKQVKAYVGNSPTTADHQNDVDMVTASRSTGSLLKPFLYSAMLDAGELLPHTLVGDVPTQYKDYSPKNFDEEYNGAIPASEALYRSLNIPSIRMLSSFGVGRFHHYLQELQLTDIKYKPSHYGLSLVLGGAESSLWDLTKAYAGLGSTLVHFEEDYGKYYSNEFDGIYLEKDASYEKGKEVDQYPVYSAASLWHCMEALRQVTRPNENRAWEYFASGQRIAWKTGTSFGNKDAWAIGITPDYVVGVWVGNADGEGRAGVTGVAAAAPLLFNIFQSLPQSESWFEEPLKELYPTKTCSRSGYLASLHCNTTDTTWISRAGTNFAPCPYHRTIHTANDGAYRVNINCEAPEQMTAKSWFVLPTAWEWYYKRAHPEYRSLPPYKAGCEGEDEQRMAFIYPGHNAQLSIPTNINQEKERIVARLAHQKPETEVFWYVDEQYIGRTADIHEMELQPEPGKHLLSAMDNTGNQIFRHFTVK